MKIQVWLMHLEVISGVYGGIGNCSVKIGNGDDGKYVVTLTGTGRDNPYTDYNKTMVMRIEVDIDSGTCRYVTDSDIQWLRDRNSV